MRDSEVQLDDTYRSNVKELISINRMWHVMAFTFSLCNFVYVCIRMRISGTTAARVSPVSTVMTSHSQSHLEFNILIGKMTSSTVQREVRVTQSKAIRYADG